MYACYVTLSFVRATVARSPARAAGFSLVATLAQRAASVSQSSFIPFCAAARSRRSPRSCSRPDYPAHLGDTGVRSRRTSDSGCVLDGTALVSSPQPARGELAPASPRRRSWHGPPAPVPMPLAPPPCAHDQRRRFWDPFEDESARRLAKACRSRSLGLSSPLTCKSPRQIRFVDCSATLASATVQQAISEERTREYDVVAVIIVASSVEPH